MTNTQQITFDNQGRSVKLFLGGAKLTDFVTEYFEKKDKYNFTF